jgi:FkbM family methyltransferase
MKNLKSIDEHKSLVKNIRSGRKYKFITYAMRDYTYSFVKNLLSAENILANFDSDENKWGKRLDMGVLTMPLDALYEISQKADGIIVMSSAIWQIGEYLDGLGLSYYFGRIMNEEMPDEIQEKINIERTAIASNQKKIQKVRSLLSDSRSVEIYDAVLSARTSYNSIERFNLFRACMTDDQYFPDQIPFPITNDEVLVDGGAYDGDTIKRFINITEGNFRHIHAFEPDTVNFSKLVKLFQNNAKVTCYNKGLYSGEMILEFVNAGQSISHIKNDIHFGVENDNFDVVKIEVCDVDNTIHSPVTFIKMDIEGSEMEALRGACKTISKNKPKLAISIYHKIEDIWEIPLYIYSLAKDYNFYIGHHTLALDDQDTVLYALK